MGYIRFNGPHVLSLIILGWARLRLYPFRGVHRWRNGWLLFTRSSTYWVGRGEP